MVKKSIDQVFLSRYSRVTGDTPEINAVNSVLDTLDTLYLYKIENPGDAKAVSSALNQLNLKNIGKAVNEKRNFPEYRRQIKETIHEKISREADDNQDQHILKYVTNISTTSSVHRASQWYQEQIQHEESRVARLGDGKAKARPYSTNVAAKLQELEKARRFIAEERSGDNDQQIITGFSKVASGILSRLNDKYSEQYFEDRLSALSNHEVKIAFINQFQAELLALRSADKNQTVFSDIEELMLKTDEIKKELEAGLWKSKDAEKIKELTAEWRTCRSAQKRRVFIDKLEQDYHRADPNRKEYALRRVQYFSRLHREVCEQKKINIGEITIQSASDFSDDRQAVWSAITHPHQDRQIAGMSAEKFEKAAARYRLACEQKTLFSGGDEKKAAAESLVDLYRSLENEGLRSLLSANVGSMIGAVIKENNIKSKLVYSNWEMLDAELKAIRNSKEFLSADRYAHYDHRDLVNEYLLIEKLEKTTSAHLVGSALQEEKKLLREEMFRRVELKDDYLAEPFGLQMTARFDLESKNPIDQTKIDHQGKSAIEYFIPFLMADEDYQAKSDQCFEALERFELKINPAGYEKVFSVILKHSEVAANKVIEDQRSLFPGGGPTAGTERFDVLTAIRTQANADAQSTVSSLLEINCPWVDKKGIGRNIDDLCVIKKAYENINLLSLNDLLQVQVLLNIVEKTTKTKPFFPNDAQKKDSKIFKDKVKEIRSGFQRQYLKVCDEAAALKWRHSGRDEFSFSEFLKEKIPEKFPGGIADAFPGLQLRTDWMSKNLSDQDFKDLYILQRAFDNKEKLSAGEFFELNQKLDRLEKVRKQPRFMSGEDQRSDAQKLNYELKKFRKTFGDQYAMTADLSVRREQGEKGFLNRLEKQAGSNKITHIGSLVDLEFGTRWPNKNFKEVDLKALFVVQRALADINRELLSSSDIESLRSKLSSLIGKTSKTSFWDSKAEKADKRELTKYLTNLRDSLDPKKQELVIREFLNKSQLPSNFSIFKNSNPAALLDLLKASNNFITYGGDKNKLLGISGASEFLNRNIFELPEGCSNEQRFQIYDQKLELIKSGVGGDVGNVVGGILEKALTADSFYVVASAFLVFKEQITFEQVNDFLEKGKQFLQNNTESLPLEWQDKMLELHDYILDRGDLDSHFRHNFTVALDLVCQTGYMGFEPDQDSLDYHLWKAGPKNRQEALFYKACDEYLSGGLDKLPVFSGEFDPDHEGRHVKQLAVIKKYLATLPAGVHWDNNILKFSDEVFKNTPKLQGALEMFVLLDEKFGTRYIADSLSRLKEPGDSSGEDVVAQFKTDKDRLTRAQDNLLSAKKTRFIELSKKENFSESDLKEMLILRRWVDPPCSNGALNHKQLEILKNNLAFLPRLDDKGRTELFSFADEILRSEDIFGANNKISPEARLKYLEACLPIFYELDRGHKKDYVGLLLETTFAKTVVSSKEFEQKKADCFLKHFDVGDKLAEADRARILKLFERCSPAAADEFLKRAIIENDLQFQQELQEFRGQNKWFRLPSDPVAQPVSNKTAGIHLALNTAPKNEATLLAELGSLKENNYIDWNAGLKKYTKDLVEKFVLSCSLDIAKKIGFFSAVIEQCHKTEKDKMNFCSKFIDKLSENISSVTAPDVKNLESFCNNVQGNILKLSQQNPADPSIEKYKVILGVLVKLGSTKAVTFISEFPVISKVLTEGMGLEQPAELSSKVEKEKVPPTSTPTPS